MRKPFAISLLLICFSLSGCIQSPAPSEYASKVPETAKKTANSLDSYTIKSNGNLVAPDGAEYVYVCNEGFLELLGKKKMIGKIAGEVNVTPYGFDTGLYICEQDTDSVMLLSYMPKNEWGMFYRKKTASMLDISYKNCVRLEFIENRELDKSENMYSAGAEHITCGKGITGDIAVQAFFRTVKSGETTHDEQRSIGKVYGFFEGESAAAIPFPVWSCIDGSYAICLDGDGVFYLLPANTLDQLRLGK